MLEGDGMIKRIQYRKAVQQSFLGKKPAIAKGEVFKRENTLAKNVEDHHKHEDFGFNCLHYSVSEASGTLNVMVLNKKKGTSRVRFTTVDAEAHAGKDYERVDQVLEFSKGEAHKFVTIPITDDDNWEPDKDFFCILYNADSNE